MMINDFVKLVLWKRTINSRIHALLSLSCCFILILGELVPSSSHDGFHTFQVGEEVVVQNTYEGIDVWEIPRPEPHTVYDGTRGIVLSEPRMTSSGIWYKVEWMTVPKVTTGWSLSNEDGCDVIGTTERAAHRDKITSKLFKMSLEKDENTGLHQVDQETNHEYNGYGCNLTWKEKNAEGKDELVYDGGHAGWDVQTKNVVTDKTIDVPFYSLTDGMVIRATEGDSNTASVIAIYDGTMTTLYLHAREVRVNKDFVFAGDLLGIQGDTGKAGGVHVHIEVKEGIHELASPGAGLSHAPSQEPKYPNVDPIPYLYKVVTDIEQRTNPVRPIGGGPSAIAPDVDQDGQVDISDILLVWKNIGNDVQVFPHLDVNNDGTIDKEDIVEVAKNLDDPVAAAPAVIPYNPLNDVLISERQVSIGNIMVSHKTVQQWLDIVREVDDGSFAFKRAIATLESLLTKAIYEKTALLPNYPNPFNPETWIPYKLSKSAEVTVTIYKADGRVARTLVLGHQTAGVYQDKNRAAYWNGKNEFGEPVASGIYFYTLKAGEFTATRKMLIRK